MVAVKKGDATLLSIPPKKLENTGLEDTIGAIGIPVLLGMYTHVFMFNMFEYVRACHVRTCHGMFEGRAAGRKSQNSALKVPQNIK